MRKVRVGDYVKIKPGSGYDDFLYLVKEVQEWYIYLDWRDRNSMDNYRKVPFENVEVIYEAGVDPY
jgi:hypothetical protein